MARQRDAPRRIRPLKSQRASRLCRGDDSQDGPPQPAARAARLAGWAAGGQATARGHQAGLLADGGTAANSKRLLPSLAASSHSPQQGAVDGFGFKMAQQTQQRLAQAPPGGGQVGADPLQGGASTTAPTLPACVLAQPARQPLVPPAPTQRNSGGRLGTAALALTQPPVRPAPLQATPRGQRPSPVPATARSRGRC